MKTHRIYVALLLALVILLQGCSLQKDYRDRKQMSLDDCYEAVSIVCEKYGYELEEGMFYEEKDRNYEIRTNDTRFDIYISDDTDSSQLGKYNCYFEIYYKINKEEPVPADFNLNLMVELVNSVAEYKTSEDELMEYMTRIRNKIYSPDCQYTSWQYNVDDNNIMLDYSEFGSDDDYIYQECLSMSGPIKLIE